MNAGEEATSSPAIRSVEVQRARERSCPSTLNASQSLRRGLLPLSSSNLTSQLFIQSGKPSKNHKTSLSGEKKKKVYNHDYTLTMFSSAPPEGMPLHYLNVIGEQIAIRPMFQKASGRQNYSQ